MPSLARPCLAGIPKSAGAHSSEFSLSADNHLRLAAHSESQSQTAVTLLTVQTHKLVGWRSCPETSIVGGSPTKRFSTINHHNKESAGIR